MRARTKLALQLLVAVGLCASGVRFRAIDLGAHHYELGWLSWPATLLWVLGVTNALNLIDGLDGLATSIAAVACAALAVEGWSIGDPGIALLGACVLGALMAFLAFNLPPAHIFLGDCGSLSLGVFLAGIAVVGSMESPSWVSIAIPLLALSIPILDSMYCIVRRLIEGRSPFSPDLGHIHHHLSHQWSSPAKAFLGIAAMTALITALGVSMLWLDEWPRVMVFAAGGLIAAGFFVVTGHVRPLARARELARFWWSLGQRRTERKIFETLELEIGRAETLEEWWRVIRQAGERLGFESIAIRMEGRALGAERLQWRREPVDAEPPMTMRLQRSFHANGSAASVLEAELRVHGCVLSAGRRFAFFGRLLDKHRSLPPAGAKKRAQPLAGKWTT